MKQQQPKQQMMTQTTGQVRAEEPKVRRQRLQLDLLEARVAPNAIWGE